MHIYNDVYIHKIILMMSYEYCLKTHMYNNTCIHTIMYTCIQQYWWWVTSIFGRHIYTMIYIHIYNNIYIYTTILMISYEYSLNLNLYTGWRRLIGCLKSQVIARKRATNYRALLRKMTYKDKASYDFTPPCV